MSEWISLHEIGEIIEPEVNPEILFLDRTVVAKLTKAAAINAGTEIVIFR
jgi:hypothetical protein